MPTPSSSTDHTPSIPHNHLNSAGLVIKSTSNTGRGVYASQSITRRTVVEISPVLLFGKSEYEEHGRFTVLDHYTFKWGDGRMALALGLGSLFNHSGCPNVSFELDKAHDCIFFRAKRDIKPNEELCIHYGNHLWFTPANPRDDSNPMDENDDGWGGLLSMDGTSAETSPIIQMFQIDKNPFSNGDPHEWLDDDQLPFKQYKLPPEEEEPGSIRTLQAWVVDVPDPTHITIMLKWLKQTGLDTSNLGHLKRVRKFNDTTTILLSADLHAPILPKNIHLPQPYALPVPASAALTLPSLALKCALWPTTYAPKRKTDIERWTRGKARWAWDAMQRTVYAALRAHTAGELPIAAHIPSSYPDDETYDTSDYTACDTRCSNAHPLRHATMNVIRQLADARSNSLVGSISTNLITSRGRSSAANPVSTSYPATPTNTATLSTPSTEHPIPTSLALAPAPATSAPQIPNGTNYLLTGRTLFITHEPCIMCSMALLHSRVHAVIYLRAAPRTGACGGGGVSAVCVPSLPGVNHRFVVGGWRWTRGADRVGRGGESGEWGEGTLLLDDNVDV